MSDSLKIKRYLNLELKDTDYTSLEGRVFTRNQRKYRILKYCESAFPSKSGCRKKVFVCLILESPIGEEKDNTVQISVCNVLKELGL